MLDLKDAFFFAKVVEHGGFSPAARVLGVSKSGLSVRIARLEQQLGARLIQRSTRRFGVTDLGREFHQHVCAMLVEADAAEQVVRRHVAEPTGAIKVASSATTLHSGLASVVVDFLAAFPKVCVELLATNRQVDLIEEGFDASVRAHEGDLPDSELLARRLGFSPRLLVAAPSYVAKHGAPGSPADLREHVGLVMPGAHARSGWALSSRDGGLARVDIPTRYVVDDTQTLKIAAVAGAGVAALPAGLCVADLKQGLLTQVLPDWRCGGAFITVLTPERRGQLPSVRAFVEFVATRLPVKMCLTA